MRTANGKGMARLATDILDQAAINDFIKRPISAKCVNEVKSG